MSSKLKWKQSNRNSIDWLRKRTSKRWSAGSAKSSSKSQESKRSSDPSRHPIHPRLLVPLRRHLLRLRPELDRSSSGDVAHAELRLVPAAEAERLARHRHADIHADHPRARVLHHVARDAA